MAKVTMAKVPPDKSDAMYEELRTVRDRVEEVLGVLTYLARDPDMIRRQEEAIRAFFGRSRSRARVYLALSADRNMTQVADALSMKKQNVHPEIKQLAQAQLILKRTAGGRGDVWIRNPTIESVMRLSEKLRRWFPVTSAVAPTSEEVALESDGEPATEAVGS